jgi:anti-sigma factor RsiW
VIDLGRNCRRYRPALVDFIDHGEVVDPDTGLALAHLDRCERCTTELEAIVLAITALRRLGDDASRIEPSPDAWPRLRMRLERWRPIRLPVMSPSLGMVMSMALVAVLVVPLRIGGAAPTAAGPTAGPTSLIPSLLIERRVEADYISSTHQGTLPATQPVTRSTGTFPRNYPDNYRPDRKEVSPAEPSGRPPEAI